MARYINLVSSRTVVQVPGCSHGTDQTLFSTFTSSHVSYGLNMIPLVLFGLFGQAISLPARLSPTVSVKNGTYAGVYSPQYDQDFFLGMPYAQVRYCS